MKLEEWIEPTDIVSQRTHNVLLLWVVINFASFKFLPKKKKKKKKLISSISVYALSLSLSLSPSLYFISCTTLRQFLHLNFFPICKNTKSKISLYSKVPKQVQRSTLSPKINCSLQFSNADFCLVRNWQKREGKKGFWIWV